MTVSSASASVVFETLEELRTVVAYHTVVSPSDAEWDAWLAATLALVDKVSDVRLIVVTEGGHPSKRQIDRLAQAMHRREHGTARTALISSAAVIRFATAAMTFLNPLIRCFAPSHRARAYAYLGLSAPEGTIVDAAVERLRKRMHTANSAVR